jgi:hypothetical protein
VIPRWVCGATLVASIAIATVRDDRHVPPPETRNGYLVLSCDFHAHTRFSDGLMSPWDLVVLGQRAKLDAFAITEHNQIFPAEMGRWWSRRVSGPTIVIGEEITTRHFHLLALGLRERVPAMPARQAIDAIHEQGALAFAAHPTRRFWPVLEPLRGELDGVEVMHPIALRPGSPQWNHEDIVKFHDEWPRGRPIAIGTSDYHGGPVLGLVRTLVFAERNDEAAIMDALRAGRTVVESPRGRRFGDPDCIDALERQPLKPRLEQRRETRDRILNGLGVFGALGWVLFGKRRPRQSTMTQTS